MNSRVAKIVKRYLARKKIAATMKEILKDVDPLIVKRSEDISFSGKDHDRGGRILRYRVKNKGYIVTIHATPVEGKDHRHYQESDIQVHCTCPAFRWQGASFHANQDDYLYDPEISKGRTFKPVIRDPSNIHLVCKHIYRALQESKRIYFDYVRK